MTFREVKLAFLGPERECAGIDKIKFKTAAGVLYLHNVANVFEVVYSKIPFPQRLCFMSLFANK